MCFLQITIRYPCSFSQSSGVAEPESGIFYFLQILPCGRQNFHPMLHWLSPLDAFSPLTRWLSAVHLFVPALPEVPLLLTAASVPVFQRHRYSLILSHPLHFWLYIWVLLFLLPVQISLHNPLSLHFCYTFLSCAIIGSRHSYQSFCKIILLFCYEVKTYVFIIVISAILILIPYQLMPFPSISLKVSIPIPCIDKVSLILLKSKTDFFLSFNISIYFSSSIFLSL